MVVIYIILVCRSVLFWEHSALAILSVVNVLLACGSHRKVSTFDTSCDCHVTASHCDILILQIQGAVLFLCGMLCLIVFDNDHLSHADHRILTLSISIQRVSNAVKFSKLESFRTS